MDSQSPGFASYWAGGTSDGCVVFGGRATVASGQGGSRIDIVFGCDSTVREATIVPRLGAFLGLTDDWILVGLLLTCVSTAASSYILARQLGGDAQLMAGIVAIQTVLSIGISPGWCCGLPITMNWIRLT